MRKRFGRRRKRSDPEPGEERHQPGKSNQEPVDPYAIRYLRWEWTQHRKVTSPGTSETDLQNIVAYLRTLQKPLPGTGSTKEAAALRSGRFASPPPTQAVVCVYVHNCCAFSHERLTLVSPGLSFVRTFTIAVNVRTNNR